MRLTAVLLALLLVALPLALPRSAPAQELVYDPANFWQQVAQYAQMILDYYQQYKILVEEIQAVAHLYEQIELMLENLEDIEDLASDNPGRAIAAIWAELYRLEGVLYVAEDVVSRFDQLYHLGAADDLVRAERDRASQTLATLRGLLLGSRTTHESSGESSARLHALTNQLDAAAGNLQALQAVGALTSQVATETTRLAEVHAMSLNALTVTAAHELATQEVARAHLLDWIERARRHQPPPPQTFSVVPEGFPAAE